jgi:beta-glucosidase
MGIPNEPLYPFGHGLGYAAVEYGPTRCSAAAMARDGELTISAEVRNRGERAVDEVVQLYVRDRVASVVQPVRRLQDFRKIELGAGVAETITFRLAAAGLGFLDQELERRIEPGDFDVWIAPSARAGQPARFTLL